MIKRSMLTGPLANRPPAELQAQKESELSTIKQALRPAKGPAPETTEDIPESSEELWKKIQTIIPDRRSQRLAYLLYNCGLKPREIIHSCGQEFNDLQEIYRLRHNIIEQLLQHKLFAE